MANADVFDSGFSLGVKKGSKGKTDSDGTPAAKQGKDVKGSFKKGGNVRKTGLYKLHKGEVVVPAKKAKSRKKISAKR